MSSTKRPSFTPFLLVNPVLRNVPTFAIERLCRHAMTTMHRRHKSIFERVTEHETFSLLISPTDLDMDLFLVLDPHKPELRPAQKGEENAVAARIIGPLPALLGLLEGKSDGDALFFSRALRIEGRTDLVVALRNALDGEDIDLRSAVSESFGVLGPAARIALRVAERVYQQMQSDMNRVADTLISPIEKRLNGLDRRLADQGENIAGLEKSARRRTPRSNRPVSSIDDFALPDHP
ncbi:ubiquinone anaerobic biosynthesis accessory factor UbiT [Thalassospira alkalitolerans]|uniref:ubiquinone anaerobic biosynthesis accessory factor UbiT n=1 Tax=Thalassospira alkalitolerans TaxID=1293890 RepID=UPI00267FACC3